MDFKKTHKIGMTIAIIGSWATLIFTTLIIVDNTVITNYLHLWFIGALITFIGMGIATTATNADINASLDNISKSIQKEATDGK